MSSPILAPAYEAYSGLNRPPSSSGDEVGGPEPDADGEVLVQSDAPQTIPFVAPSKQRTKAKASPIKPPDYQDLTDLGNARRLVAQFKDRLRYCEDWREWLVYGNGRWNRGSAMSVQRFAQEYVEGLRSAGARIRDRSEGLRYDRAVRRCESHSAITAMIQEARSDPRVAAKSSDFDQDPFMLNCRNGTLDLKAGRLRPHSPADNLTKLAPVDFLTGATCPTWEEGLRKVLAGEQELIDYFRRAVGYAMTGDVSEQCFFLCYGEGSNGKGTLLHTIARILGDDYAMDSTSNFLTATSSEHPTVLADLKGIRFVALIEPKVGRMDEALMKMLTGGDPIRARKLYEDHSQFRPTHALFMATNNKPEIRELTYAVWRRIKVIFFPARFEGEGKTLNMEDAYMAEASGILNWLLAGCLEWQRIGLNEPASVTRQSAAYRDEMDPIGGFIEARCLQSKEHEVKTSDLWRCYKDWFNSAGGDSSAHVSSSIEFGRLLSEKGFPSKKKHGGVMWRPGIAIRPDDLDSGPEDLEPASA